MLVYAREELIYNVLKKNKFFLKRQILAIAAALHLP